MKKQATTDSTRPGAAPSSRRQKTASASRIAFGGAGALGGGAVGGTLGAAAGLSGATLYYLLQKLRGRDADWGELAGTGAGLGALGGAAMGALPGAAVGASVPGAIGEALRTTGEAATGQPAAKTGAYIVGDDDEDEDEPSLLGSMARGALYGGLGGAGAGFGAAGWQRGYKPYSEFQAQAPELRQRLIEGDVTDGAPRSQAQERADKTLNDIRERLGGGPVGATWRGATSDKGLGQAGRWGLYGAGAGAALGALRYLLS